MHIDSLDLSRRCSFTGHRPARFPFGYDENDERCVKIKAVLAEQIALLVADGVTIFYSGMALAVDQWAAEIVLDMKKLHHNLLLIAIRPCETQADRWSEAQRERHRDTLALCDEVITLHPKYKPGCMHERNRFLVDHAGHLLAVYDGDASGGTAYTVRYARKQGRRISAIHPDTLEVTQIFHND
ncbi:MAG: DUF1273 domain-containing protein [Defluviitaleaceae bacterium]|nr:DUF1273 domain-containing protein [Defluviitaleaceae bacterium]